MRWPALAWIAVAVVCGQPSQQAAAQARDAEPAYGEAVVSPAFYPEGPLLTRDGLFFAEMSKDRVRLYNGKTTEVVWELARCGPTSIKSAGDKGYWILCHLGNAVVMVDRNFKNLSLIKRVEDGTVLSSPNDASTDPEGNLYLSSSGVFDNKAPAEGRLIRVDLDGRARTLASGIRYSNGVTYDRKRQRILVSEHLAGRILSYAMDGVGRVQSQPTVFFDFRNAPTVKDRYEQSGPDGQALLPDGSLLVADYGNGRLLHLSVDGQFLHELPVRYRFVTNMVRIPGQNLLYVVMSKTNSVAPYEGVVERVRLNFDVKE